MTDKERAYKEIGSVEGAFRQDIRNKLLNKRGAKTLKKIATTRKIILPEFVKQKLVQTSKPNRKLSCDCIPQAHELISCFKR